MRLLNTALLIALLVPLEAFAGPWDPEPLLAMASPPFSDPGAVRVSRPEGQDEADTPEQIVKHLRGIRERGPRS